MLYGSSNEKGKLLARGTGVNSMMDTSYKRKYNNDNTILEVSNPDDFNSSWRIYERKKA